MDVTSLAESEHAFALNDLKTRVQGAKTVWNLDEMLDIIQILIEDDEKLLLTQQELISDEEKLLNDKKASLATASTDNALLSHLEELKVEASKLACQKDSMADKENSYIKNKKATHEIHPIYSQYCRTLGEKERTEKLIQETNSKMETVKAMEQEVSLALAEAQKNVPQITELKEQVVSLKKEENKYELRDQLVKNIEVLEQKEKQYLLQKDNLDNLENQLQIKIQKLNSDISANENKPEEKVKLIGEYEKVQTLKDSIEQVLTKQAEEYATQVKLWKEKVSVFEQKKKEDEVLEAREKELKEKIEGNRIGVLVQKLKIGDACPVCRKTVDVIPECPEMDLEEHLEEKYELVQEERKDASARREEASLQAAEARVTMSHMEEQIILDSQRLLKDELYKKECVSSDIAELALLLEEEKAWCFDRISNLNNQISAINEACNVLQNAKSALVRAQNEETAKLGQEKNNNASSLADCQNKLAENRGLMDGMKSLAYKDLAEAVNARKSIENSISELERPIELYSKRADEVTKELAGVIATLEAHTNNLKLQEEEQKKTHAQLEQAIKEKEFESMDDFLNAVIPEGVLQELEAEINGYNNKVRVITAQLQDAEKNATGKVKVDVTKLQEDVNEQTSKVTALRSKETEITLRIARNRNSHQQITVKKPILDSIISQYNMNSKLYDLVAGSENGGKLSLEQYIQGYGFDRILHAANRRLLPLSDNMYELRRQTGPLGKKSSNFLDLEIYNRHTGYSRPASNLSGGESFKASLSLALGLADMVSNNAGGIQMDALFIDEGFGTLDRKSIDNSLEVLLKLSSTNKLIGVISHREELMANIPQKIMVKKDNHGSRMEIKIDNL